MKARKILHLDLDAFFCAVEELRAILRWAGKPVCCGRLSAGTRGGGFVLVCGAHVRRAFGDADGTGDPRLSGA